MISHEAVRTVAVVGTGVIGASWVAHFLAHGLDVVGHRPLSRREARLRDETSRRTGPAWSRSGWSTARPSIG